MLTKSLQCIKVFPGRDLSRSELGFHREAGCQGSGWIQNPSVGRAAETKQRRTQGFYIGAVYQTVGLQKQFLPTLVFFQMCKQVFHGIACVGNDRFSLFVYPGREFRERQGLLKWIAA